MNRTILDPITHKFIDTGEPIKRFPHSEETKKKISMANKGKHDISGWHHSEETKDKISIAQQGKYISDEIRERISIATKKAMKQYLKYLLTVDSNCYTLRMFPYLVTL